MENKRKEICPLCCHTGSSFYLDRYFQCPDCRGIYISEHYKPDPESERARYETHNNDTEDSRYQKFVEPVVEMVVRDFSPCRKGLDFGAGTGPVISKMLSDKRYDIKQYDPFFHNEPQLLRDKYDYVICCEVIEHFHQPAKEWERLKNLLLPGGSVICMTHIYEPSIDFPKWYYKNDETHVFIYMKETLEWLREKYGFCSLTIKERLVCFGS